MVESKVIINIININLICIDMTDTNDNNLKKEVSFTTLPSSSK